MAMMTRESIFDEDGEGDHPGDQFEGESPEGDGYDGEGEHFDEDGEGDHPGDQFDGESP